MAPPIKFSAARKARVLKALRAGDTIQKAAADAGVSRATVQAHVGHGRTPGASKAERSFTEAFDRIRSGQDLSPLTEDDLVRLLERAARLGSVTACKVLLARFAEGHGSGENATAQDEADPFAALERAADELAARRDAKRRVRRRDPVIRSKRARGR